MPSIRNQFVYIGDRLRIDLQAVMRFDMYTNDSAHGHAVRSTYRGAYTRTVNDADSASIFGAFN